MNKEEFTSIYYPMAEKAGARFNMDSAIILAQAAIESGWGTSYGARERKNFFGLTASGQANEYWDGRYSISQNEYQLKFRIYRTAQDSFYDFARLISSHYAAAHAQSQDSTAYARAIAYSPYITEANGDNRENYRMAIISSFNSIVRILKKKGLRSSSHR